MIRIRPMLSADLAFAASLAAAEGWDSETLPELESLHAYQPSTCFVAELDGGRVGTCIAVPYRDFGFVGELIVVPEARGQGIGRLLLEAACRSLQDRRIRSIFLDGVLPAVPLYERLGFHKVCRSWRLAGRLPAQPCPQVRPMLPADLPAISALDRQAFGADRRFFLERRLAVYPRLCLLLESQGRIDGFVLARQGRTCVSVGPLVLSPAASDAACLLGALASETGDAELRLGVLDVNPPAIAMLEAFGLERNPASPWRMLLGDASLPGDPSLAFAIGSPAKG
jgi:ribosomal protein S18 acetylase RimI-like enzyme